MFNMAKYRFQALPQQQQTWKYSWSLCSRSS
ncbi:hypothetical protein RO3G_00468 [Rhizopus delemar RA 99-880]|uniref:Uncharacterized protein n=1 Tax=Rhizopus delemar (strain RA 99-880 / ATCC MYA-4621 / FGSC 9543 / NRRL 43880) TaxID=246409 RepID=I1BHT4_RHIO9|nr:hypothetical protein RO3G_00468 [Rhizopus delemar RA 99-880]|eukprot:EIE75764.1 hypothetical protein RO3G_00468 [Rhizopus delemar RA 99-880]